MPQMAPYNWLFLFIIITFLLLMMISYINSLNSNLTIKSYKSLNKKFIWKW